MKARWCLPLLVLVTTGLGAGPELEFTGVLTAGRETKIYLTEKSSGQSRWLTLGQEFGGYVVSSYDTPTESVVLTRDGQQFRLKLKDAKVKAGRGEPSPEIKRALLNNLRQLAAAADQYYLENGKTQVTLDELVGETKYVKKLVVIDGENYGQLVFAQGRPLVITTAGGYTISYDP